MTTFGSFSKRTCVSFLFDVFVLRVTFVPNMKSREPKSESAKTKPANSEESKSAVKPVRANQTADTPNPNAFLEEAKLEPKRVLMSDYSETITLLRNEKRFTFREIAAWLTERGIEADHSAVYRAYLAAIPENLRDPRESYEEVETPE